MAQLPNNAKLPEIIAALQNMTGVNQLVEIANALTAKGYTLTGAESMADLAAILKDTKLINTAEAANPATAAQLMNGRVAFVNGAKLTGNNANLVDTTTAAAIAAAQVLAPREGFANGAKVVGTMQNRATFGVSGGPGDGGPNGRHNSGFAPWVPVGGGWVYARVPQGYYPGLDEWVYLNDPDFIAPNIRSGRNILGIDGTLVPGVPFASGQITGNGSGNVIAGLSFRPRIAWYHEANASGTALTYFDDIWNSGSYEVVQNSTTYAQVIGRSVNNQINNDGFMSTQLYSGVVYNWYAIG